MALLVLLRHGQSMWNLRNVFTGWVDVPLSSQGVEEAVAAGKKMAGIDFDIVYVSTLVRAMETAMIALSENKSGRTPVVEHPEGSQIADWGKIYSDDEAGLTIPVVQDSRLNERYYGELQGLNKKATAERFGDEQVHIWRRSYDVPPPNGEALVDTAGRTIPFFKEAIVPSLEEGQNVLVSAHGNSLRSIVMDIERLDRDGVLNLEIPTGKPIFYHYENGKFEKIMDK